MERDRRDNGEVSRNVRVKISESQFVKSIFDNNIDDNFRSITIR